MKRRARSGTTTIALTTGSPSLRTGTAVIISTGSVKESYVVSAVNQAAATLTMRPMTWRDRVRFFLRSVVPDMRARFETWLYPDYPAIEAIGEDG